jgi:hypothetical protein
VFIVLEGIDDQGPVTYFMDFVTTDRLKNFIKPGVHDGKVRMKQVTGEGTLIFKCGLSLMEIRKSKKIKYWTCEVSRSQGEALVRAVVEAQRRPPKYSAFGYGNAFTSLSAILASNYEGHNCWTWAFEILQELDHLPEKFSDFKETDPPANNHPSITNFLNFFNTGNIFIFILVFLLAILFACIPWNTAK